MSSNLHPKYYLSSKPEAGTKRKHSEIGHVQVSGDIGPLVSTVATGL